MTANRELENEIAERLRMEESLRQAEEKYRSIFENANEGIFQTTPEGRLLIVNPALARMLGYESAEQLVKAVTSIINLYHRKEDRQELICQLEAHGAIRNFEVQFHRLDGAIIWVSLAGHVVRDADGSVLYYEGTAEDITESKNLETQLRHSQKMEAIGTLTGGIAHDFNNILTAVTGHASLLEMKMADDDPLAHHVGKILAAADRAANLTRSLLTFSRKQALDQRPMNLNDVVTRVGELLMMLLKKDIELSSSLMNEPLPVMADSGQIEQVLMNLASNARDAMPHGGIVTISTAAVDIDHEFLTAHGFGVPGRYALLSITDSGTGMDKKTREKIFEPFFTTKGVGKGTGLGLSISYGIIKQHHGYINCYSEPGIGTTFKIYLPVIEQMPGGKGTIPHAENRQGNEPLLLVEDDSQTRSANSELLERFGYQVIVATDGEDAVTKFKAHGDLIRLIISDVIMPIKNGKVACDEIRKIAPGIKVLFTSGYPEEIFQKKEAFTDGFRASVYHQGAREGDRAGA